MTRLERNLRATVSQSTNRGLDAVKRIAEERQLTGVYGPLIDNFVLKKEEAAVAVDVTAGNRFANFKLKLFQTWLKLIVACVGHYSTFVGCGVH